MVVLNVTFESPTVADINATVFGSALPPCDNEPVLYVPTNKTIVLPNIQKSNDCVAQVLQQYGLDPTILVLTYDTKADVINLLIDNGSGTGFSMKHCQ